MDEPRDKQPGSNEKLWGPGGDNLAMDVLAEDVESHEPEDKTLEEELTQLKELIAELKGNLIAVNRGIVARQDTIDQLTKRKQELLQAYKEQTTSAECSSPRVIHNTSALQGLVDKDNPFARNAVEIFPEEVWELIFGKLTESKDLRNCSTSCQLFDNILHPLKQNFLFIDVFPHMYPYLDNDLILRCRRVCKGWNEGVDSFVENHPARIPCGKVDPNPRYPPPSKNGLFRLEFSNKLGDLRELNFVKKMRHHSRNPFVGRAVFIRVVEHDAVDDDRPVNENNENDSDDDYDDDAGDWELGQFADNYEEGEDNSEDDSFTDEGEDDNDEDNWDTESDGDSDVYGEGLPPFGVSPDFLPPNEAIGIRVDQQKKLFWQGLLKFLEIFGKHIWHLSFECLREGSFIINEDSVFRFLTKRIFILAPNLRTFEISGYLPRPNPLMPRRCLVSPKLETLRIERDRRRWTFEDLPKGSLSDYLIHASFQQLKQLRVDWANWKHIFKSNLEWSNLTELYINYDGLGGELDARKVVPSRMPHLKKLGFAHRSNYFEWDGDKCDFDFEEIMRIIIGLSARTNLHILRLMGGIEMEQVLETPIRLFAPPNLKTLEMDHPSWRGGYDYTLLLRFPSLENLVVFHYQSEYNSERSKAQFERQVVGMEPYMGEGRVYECEIWELLPRLKNFTVQRDVYIGEGRYNWVSSTFTRECYEQIISHKNNLEIEIK